MTVVGRKNVVVGIAIVATLYTVHMYVGIEVYSKEVRHKNSEEMKVSFVPTTTIEVTTVAEEIESTAELDVQTTQADVELVTTDEYCPDVSPLLNGSLNIQFDHRETDEHNWPPTFEEIAVTFPNLNLGGIYPGPSSCRPKHNLSIIIPFRDREEHLRYFLYYTHLILQRQQAGYRIYVIEQDDTSTFNKGQLMNTGFLYAMNQSENQGDCIIFHDVDTISEDDRGIYKCAGGDEVVHLSSRIDKFKYNFCCGMNVGGVLGFRKHQFRAINGFSNLYFGWGGEDNDMKARILQVGKYSIYRPPEDFIKFKMISHTSDEKNPLNNERFKLLNDWKQRQASDGLNSLKSTITKVIRYKTHTRVFVKPSPKQV